MVTRIVCNASDVYLTGGFTSAGEAGCIGIAKWNGSHWSGFGSGFSWGSFPIGFALAVRGSEVFVGGASITNISGVATKQLARWNGSAWSDLGGINGVVYNALFKGNDLYICGVFTNAGGVAVSNIVRWDGTNWFPLGSGLYGSTNGFLGSVGYSMALDSNGDLIVGGNFRNAGEVQANNVARWDGTNWHALGSGVFNGSFSLGVNAVAVLETNVYVAGVFRSASGINATNIARWNGIQWSAMNGGPVGTNTSLAIAGTNIYVAGHFHSIGGVAAKHIARWNGSGWQALAPGTAGEILTRVACLGTDGSNVYAGGDFVQAGTNGTLCVAKWNGDRWTALTGPKSQGAWLQPIAVEAQGSNVYVGGSALLIAGGLKPNRIAHWNGTAWDDMGGGISGGLNRVHAILKNEGDVYVGGNFTNAGGVAARNIARWDGTNWHAMASGLNSNVNALVFYGGELYAGGIFTTRGNNTGSFFSIAKWDGSDWVTVPGLTTGFPNNEIEALATDGTYLYLGGNFLIGWSGGGGAENIARFDGANWASFGLELAASVSALAFVNGELYAGGSFTNSSIFTVKRIARWDGANWVQVGDGFDSGAVADLGVIGTTLYAAGTFTNSGSTALSRIAKWNGSQWLPLGSGVSRISPTSSSVSDMAISGDDIYMVGGFTYAGGKPSAALAHWNETMSFVPPVIYLVNPRRNSAGQFQFDVSGLPSGSFAVDATTNFANWSPIYSNTVPNTNFTDTDSPNFRLRNYRVRTP